MIDAQLQSMGVDALKYMYHDDANFKEIYKGCNQFLNTFHSVYSDFLLQSGFIFKWIQSCVPRFSMRDNIIKENHSGSLRGHFGLKHTLDQVRRFYY